MDIVPEDIMLQWDERDTKYKPPKSFIENISDQKDIKPEYADLVNKHFWDLI
jgi:hypothetical protein